MQLKFEFREIIDTSERRHSKFRFTIWAATTTCCTHNNNETKTFSRVSLSSVLKTERTILHREQRFSALLAMEDRPREQRFSSDSLPHYPLPAVHDKGADPPPIHRIIFHHHHHPQNDLPPSPPSSTIKPSSRCKTSKRNSPSHCLPFFFFFFGTTETSSSSFMTTLPSTSGEFN